MKFTELVSKVPWGPVLKWALSAAGIAAVAVTVDRTVVQKPVSPVSSCPPTTLSCPKPVCPQPVCPQPKFNIQPYQVK